MPQFTNVQCSCEQLHVLRASPCLWIVLYQYRPLHVRTVRSRACVHLCHTPCTLCEKLPASLLPCSHHTLQIRVYLTLYHVPRHSKHAITYDYIPTASCAWQAALTPALESRVHLLCDPLVPFSRHRLRCAQENAQVSYYSVVTVDCLPCIACSKVRTINPTGRQVSAATKPTHAHPVSLLPRVKRARPFLVST